MVPPTGTSSMIYGLIAAILAVCFLGAHIKKRKRAPLPPGPIGLPIIGNLFELPHSYPWLAYANWAEQYGDVISFQVFGRPAILVSSAKAATELFEKRSTNYSDRPRMVCLLFKLWWLLLGLIIHYVNRLCLTS